MKKKICIATGTRAEYGLLQPLMSLIKKDKSFKLQIVATAMHLSPEFGMTVNEIERDGYKVNEKIEMLLSADTDTAIVKAMGLAMITAADVFKKLNPDLLVILGDRFEMLALAQSAYLMNIPIAHIAGGETTEGAFDEGIRHSITKMSSLHFAATEIYKKRIIQLGENPDKVFNVGALGLDNIKNMKLISKQDLEKDLKLRFDSKTALVTFHPVTLEKESPKKQFEKLLKAFEKFPKLKLIFTMPNSDTGGREIIAMINKYSEQRENAYAFTNLGQKRYLSTLKYVDLVIGNSSSGIVEVPFMGIPTLNIGDRQKGRIMGESIVNVKCDEREIVKGITACLNRKKAIGKMKNPYDNGTAAKQMLNIIKKKTEKISSKKKFFDLDF
ncbi:MAG: UDP-N-acetylglucosamine 2-epimerase (hydrolyzing) [Ignavibacteria bacterium]|nr:UDP-N-acetylglucosamine 2-epimerase (hydrolyzing) [Ignavibacteria bacterium]